MGALARSWRPDVAALRKEMLVRSFSSSSFLYPGSTCIASLIGGVLSVHKDHPRRSGVCVSSYTECIIFDQRDCVMICRCSSDWL